MRRAGGVNYRPVTVKCDPLFMMHIEVLRDYPCDLSLQPTQEECDTRWHRGTSVETELKTRHGKLFCLSCATEMFGEYPMSVVSDDCPRDFVS